MDSPNRTMKLPRLRTKDELLKVCAAKFAACTGLDLGETISFDLDHVPHAVSGSLGWGWQPLLLLPPTPAPDMTYRVNALHALLAVADLPRAVWKAASRG